MDIPLTIIYRINLDFYSVVKNDNDYYYWSFLIMAFSLAFKIMQKNR